MELVIETVPHSWTLAGAAVPTCLGKAPHYASLPLCLSASLSLFLRRFLGKALPTEIICRAFIPYPQVSWNMSQFL